MAVWWLLYWACLRSCGWLHCNVLLCRVLHLRRTSCHSEVWNMNTCKVLIYPHRMLGEWGGEALTFDILSCLIRQKAELRGLWSTPLVFLAHYQNINLADRWQQQFLFVFLTFEKLATWNMSSLQQVLEMSIGLYNESDNVCEKNPPSSCYFTIPFNLLLTQSAYFPPSVDMSCWMADCHSTNHLSMVKLVYLSGMSRDTWSDQSIGRKWHSLHLTIATNVEWICRFSSRRAWWKAWSKWRHAYSCCWRAVFKANLPK